MSFLLTVFIGMAAGWMVGVLRRGSGYGFVGNLIIGIIGSFVGSFLFGLTGLAITNLTGQLIMSVVGALFFLFVVQLVKPKRKKIERERKDDKE